MPKDILVPLDGTPEDEVRLAHAEALARTHRARITGLYLNPLPDYSYVLGIQSGLAPAALITDLDERVRREGDAVAEQLGARLARLDVPSELRRFDATPSELPDPCAAQARWADLVVATTPYRDRDTTGWNEVTEAMLLDGGHALYLVPPGAAARPAVHTVLVAWADRREAARSVAEALPILKQAGRVVLLCVKPTPDAEERPDVLDVAAHLDRHGAKVEILTVYAAAVEVPERIIAEAERLSADLVVMGAYGHSRFREWVVGGATRDMIERSAVPLLMAH